MHVARRHHTTRLVEKKTSLWGFVKDAVFRVGPASVLDGISGTRGTFGGECFLNDRALGSAPRATRSGEADQPLDVEKAKDVFGRDVHGEVDGTAPCPAFLFPPRQPSCFFFPLGTP